MPSIPLPNPNVQAVADYIRSLNNRKSNNKRPSAQGPALASASKQEEK